MSETVTINDSGCEVEFIRYTCKEIMDAWYDKRNSFYRHWLGIEPDNDNWVKFACPKTEAVFLSAIFLRDIYADPLCVHWDERIQGGTLFVYGGYGSIGTTKAIREWLYPQIKADTGPLFADEVDAT